MTLAAKAWFGVVALVVVMGLCLFAGADTLDYWQAWLFLAVYFAGSALLTLDLLRRDPALLRRRLSGGPIAEKETAQKIIMSFASAVFIAALLVPAFDRRFEWSHVPVTIVILGNALNGVWFFLVYRVFRENSFTSATIEVAQGQRVISTGPYAVVRHPMYVAGAALFLGIPLALGSYWGMLAFAVALPALIARLLHEERMLARELPGYTDYCARVRWRLVPGIF
jgi:protein-S-isoprenylcysteine O-methyltransferase Ste14